MTGESGNVPIQAVENPIINVPYAEPAAYWRYDEQTGEASKVPGRRPAQYWYRDPKTALGSMQQGLFAQDSADDLVLVNLLREDVRNWRASGYEGATPTTKELLRYWQRPERARRFFFCQLEAVETVIYIRELLETGRTTRRRPRVSVEDYRALTEGRLPSFMVAMTRAAQAQPPRLRDGDLLRLGAKMATGSGKTLVMALIITWAFCNRAKNPSEERFPGAALVLCPNLTVKERLQVLRPEVEGNYYDAFDLVPFGLRPLLNQGRVLVQNWHQLAEEAANVEGGKAYMIVNKGEESDQAFAERVLGDLYGRGQLMVLNDEAHHAYRPAPLAEREKLSAGAREDREEATVWVEGLDRLQRAVGIAVCVDLSATPFYLAGSGYIEGSPFPWLVSDFGLTDAIESGIVKIPRLPVSDATGRPEPKYYRLWEHIKSKLGPGDRAGQKPKPEAVWREAEDALLTLASQWQERFEYTEAATPDQDAIPPVMIVVCDNTDIARLFHEKISGERDAPELDDPEGDEEDEEIPSKTKTKTKRAVAYGQGSVFPELLSNDSNNLRTLRIDSKLIAEAERGGSGGKVKAGEQLREIVATVGQRGKPGESVRCVVSVQMLTEGWDANNVTHILGLRAFGSQLLCEQVVGRGLRRMNYDPDPETGLLPAEYVDVYGIPFSLIPFKGRETTQKTPEDKPLTLVRSLPERQHLEIRFPVVEGFTFSLRNNLIRADVAAMQPLKLDPASTPSAVFVKPQVGDIPMHRAYGFEATKQDRDEYYRSTHLQQIEFMITREIVQQLTEAQPGVTPKLQFQSRAQLFPQVLRLVKTYISTRVQVNGMDLRELGMERYMRLIIERFVASIEEETSGEPSLLPILNRYVPEGSTRGVRFTTKRPTKPTVLSHLSHVVGDTATWEQRTAFELEASADLIQSYARNDHLNFSISYTYYGFEHDYIPDFLVRLRNGDTLILEVKGYEMEQDRAKHQAAQRWVSAVNNWKKMGRWSFAVCHDPARVRDLLKSLQTQFDEYIEYYVNAAD